MSTYLVLPLIQASFSAVLIPVVLRGHFRSITHRLFSLFLIGLAVWGIIIFAMRASPDIGQAYFWQRFLIPVAPLTSVVLYHFVVKYTMTSIKRWVLPLLYAICVVLIPLAATDLIFSGAQIKSYGYAPVFGPIAPIHMLRLHHGIYDSNSNYKNIALCRAKKPIFLHCHGNGFFLGWSCF
jgi:hypothetical protein